MFGSWLWQFKSRYLTLSAVSALGKGTVRKRLEPDIEGSINLAVLSKCVFMLKSALIGRFPGQADVEDVEETEVFPCECSNSISLLPFFLFTEFLAKN